MKIVHRTLAAAAIVSLFVLSHPATADTFGSGGNAFEVEFVTIGDPGNAADTTGIPDPAGAVDYVFEIGKFEVSRDMVTKANAEGALEITLSQTRQPNQTRYLSKQNT